jgi:radical SAM protein with 4Fe4S-binding SPASM domain
VGAGCRSLFLRPLDPFGFASRTATSLGYPVEEFLDFYAKAVDYMIELNLRGVEVLERNAALFLTKIIAGEEPNFLDIRSPCGAGIGQVAYNHDGSVYTCDEGRMVAEMGDDAFRIGDVREDSWPDMVGHPAVRSMVLASTLDGQPGCIDCAYKPYCGVCPVYSYAEHGSIQGRTVESTLCKKHMGIQDYLFRKLRDADRPTLDVLRRWTTVREQVHFVQDCAC